MAEFALMLPLLLLLLLGVIDLGRICSVQVALANAVREGARYCALHAGDTPGTRARIRSELDGRVAVDTSSTVCSLAPPGSAVTVTAAASFTPITPFISSIVGNPVIVRAPATMVVW